MLAFFALPPFFCSPCGSCPCPVPRSHCPCLLSPRAASKVAWYGKKGYPDMVRVAREILPRLSEQEHACACASVSDKTSFDRARDQHMLRLLVPRCSSHSISCISPCSASPLACLPACVLSSLPVASVLVIFPSLRVHAHRRSWLRGSRQAPLPPAFSRASLHVELRRLRGEPLLSGCALSRDSGALSAPARAWRARDCSSRRGSCLRDSP